MNSIKVNGIKLFREEQVYFPREDSFLLAEQVKVFPQAKVLDLGCGTGLIGFIAAKQKATVLCTDINPLAVKLTEKNAAENKLEIKAMESDLFSGIKEKFDFIFFNPPYVTGEGKRKELIDKALDGGENGRKVIDRFIPEIKPHLTEKGKSFFLQSSLNGIKETEKKLEKQGLEFEVTARKKLFFEELVVFKAWKR